MEERPEEATSWKLCAVTQVEELKILLRLLPVWITSIIVSSAFSHMNTTFVQQGSTMDMTILSVPVPAASLASFEVICVLTWAFLYNLQQGGCAGAEELPLERLQQAVAAAADGRPATPHDAHHGCGGARGN
ncbi:protein NRT1/ PTR FAMILY 8.2-like [Triticum aestivum]|uniref:protein NRT1/ PTR FAMILY 8.2-like n=1 Tax=Triticum aestivum TaxID=4565 RepID=UPI001D01E7D3|nr:protein NRT1/ PTR FAMILY 8.2-like [Triticum aestivum]